LPEILKTYFAPPERSSEEEILEQTKLISENSIILSLLDSIPSLVAILNKNRQIVFANKAFKNFTQSRNLDAYLGKRPGEAISCIHADDCASGCGTSRACSVCGAVNAILLSKGNGAVNMECRITLESGEPLDLAVNANQHNIGNVEFTILTASDISHENRRKALEQIFFHDLLNIAGALSGFIEIMKGASVSEAEEYINLSKCIAEHLIEEITAQKELVLAEENELSLNLSSFSSTELLSEAAQIYKRHIASLGKDIIVDSLSETIILNSDKTLLRRVLGNLIKNALEAIQDGDSVRLSCCQKEGFVEFSVWNKSIIPESVQYQIFQRSFSTKGKGRGLGTYSVKLLTEKYLQGKAYFISSPNKGTTFYVRYPLSIE